MIRKEIEKHIRKLTGELKKEALLLPILKARLTKREYKLLLGWAAGEAQEAPSSHPGLDAEGQEALSQKLVKKLNQEKLKQELVD